MNKNQTKQRCNKNPEEEIVLQILKRLETSKYKNAYICDKPDIQEPDLSIGVEVVTGIDSKIYKSVNSIGKPIINALKMMKKTPLEPSDYEWILSMPMANLNDITDDVLVYSDESGNVNAINSIDEFKKLIKNTEIWEVSKSMLESSNEDYTTNIGFTIMKWQKEEIDLVIGNIDRKIQKYSNYKGFLELNLAVLFYYADEDDLVEAEKSIIKHYSDKYMPYDKLYLLTNSQDKYKIINFKV